jgi:4-oxalocrotonate tautomerase
MHRLRPILVNPPGGAARGTYGPTMPYVKVEITRGATRAQKAALVADITGSLVRVLGKQPEHIHVVLHEVDEENWGFSGLLTDDWKRQQHGSPPARRTPRPARRSSARTSRRRRAASSSSN